MAKTLFASGEEMKCFKRKPEAGVAGVGSPSVSTSSCACPAMETLSFHPLSQSLVRPSLIKSRAYILVREGDSDEDAR